MYQIARGLGLTGDEARQATSSHDSWLECLRAHGKNPDDYGELAVRRTGGKPRTDPERAARYRELRRRGLSAAAASRLSDKRGRYELTIKKLDKGIEVYA